MQPASAEVGGVEGIAARRVPGLVSGAVPLLALLGGSVGELAFVDGAAAERGLDEVVPDVAGGVECGVDVSVGHVGDQWPAGRSRGGARVLRPNSGVAVGLQ